MWEVVYPVGMCAIQVTIPVYHLWLDPYAEAHAMLVHTSDQAVEAIWELLRIYGPVTETCAVVVASAKPTIVDHEYLNAELRSLFSKNCLVVLIDIETCRLPRVVQNRSHVVTRSGQHLLELIGVPATAHASEPLFRVESGECRQVKMRTLLQTVNEVEIVNSSRAMDKAIGRRLNHHLPRPTPGERCTPNIPGLLSSFLHRVQGDPRVELMAGCPPPAFEHELSWTRHDLSNLHLRSPPSVEIGKTVAFPRWHPPVRREGLLEDLRTIASCICLSHLTLNPVMTVIDA